jgi:hypothetical protein
MMADMTVADVLEQAADLIEPEGKWIRGWFAHNVLGEEVEADDEDAVCWCVRGAVLRVDPDANELVVFAPLRKLLGADTSDSIEVWNDRGTQAEVVAKLRQAAAIARAQSPAPLQQGTQL